ncbi:MAG: hypothetical protein K0M74_13260 [Sphingopyxis sp.]|nr:hypothetical protein [Sphingopyxis sp.]
MMMEQVASSANLNQAYKRVKANKGAPGADGMTVADLRGWIADNRERLIVSLLDGSYRPQPVRGVEIPKAGGKGMRQLGIPTVVDRLVQQAILQVLEPLLDPGFSGSSYGFRPGRSAHDALRQARDYVADGYGTVVDLDLEKFFDRVNHVILMARLSRRIGDTRLLAIIRRFLQAGMLVNGVCIERQEGTPQGGPLSPLLASQPGHRPDDDDRAGERLHHGMGDTLPPCPGSVPIEADRLVAPAKAALRPAETMQENHVDRQAPLAERRRRFALRKPA